MPQASPHASTAKLFLCGNVMTGRGIDQILPYPNHPAIHEDYLTDAREYVRLAEQTNGSISRPVPFSYIWGDALTEFEVTQPERKIINLETAITTSDAWQAKGINYHMHPDNISCLKAARIDCCVLANNHVLDYGPLGLNETLETLDRAAIAHAGAGRTAAEAKMPAILPIAEKGRILVFSLAMQSSGVPQVWSADLQNGGVWLLHDHSMRTVEDVAAEVQRHKSLHDIAVASIHWGSNWGYDISQADVDFAHHLIDNAAIDIVHGHSSHHPRAIEIYRDRLILYGCGDFINDYEGITGYGNFRPDLSLMYFPTIEMATGRLVELNLTATRIRNLRIGYAAPADTSWLADRLNREGQRFATHFECVDERRIRPIPSFLRTNEGAEIH